MITLYRFNVRFNGMTDKSQNICMDCQETKNLICLYGPCHLRKQFLKQFFAAWFLQAQGIWSVKMVLLVGFGGFHDDAGIKVIKSYLAKPRTDHLKSHISFFFQKNAHFSLPHESFRGRQSGLNIIGPSRNLVPPVFIAFLNKIPCDASFNVGWSSWGNAEKEHFTTQCLLIADYLAPPEFSSDSFSLLNFSISAGQFLSREWMAECIFDPQKKYQ